MADSLERVAVITGASSGFGEATARKLANGGWLTVLIARREDRLRALVSEIGGEYQVCDVSDRQKVAETAAEISDRHALIKLLINNAGVGIGSNFLEAQDDDLERVIETNYHGPIRLTRALARALEAASPADIVNVASAAGQIVLPTSGPYSASKHALVAASRAMVAEFEPLGVNVHTILPGFADTEGFPQKGRLPWPLSWDLMQTTPEDVADVIVGRVGKRSGERYIPRIYKLGALANSVAPVTTVKVLERAFRPYRPAA